MVEGKFPQSLSSYMHPPSCMCASGLVPSPELQASHVVSIIWCVLCGRGDVDGNSTSVDHVGDVGDDVGDNRTSIDDVGDTDNMVELM